MELMKDHQVIRVKAWHDFSWLDEFGQVFCVFDQLISGNLCFGVESGSRKLFIKYAGAATMMYAGHPQAAIDRLKASAERYDELRHPCLGQMLGHFETPQGFGLAFQWFEGFALAPVEAHLDSLHQLPLLQRLRMFDGMMDFLVVASQRDYLVAGLANQHILVDFINNKAIFSSVGHYLRFPASVPYPKLPGSPWYLPPEGYRHGAKLDDSANVYALGALAFTFFGSTQSRLLSAWDAGKPLFGLASRAVDEKKNLRPVSAQAFQGEWRSIILNTPGF